MEDVFGPAEELLEVTCQIKTNVRQSCVYLAILYGCQTWGASQLNYILFGYNEILNN